MNKIEPELGDWESTLKDDPFVNPPLGDIDGICLSKPIHRTQEKEGRTPQEEKAFLSFIIASVVTGLVIGLVYTVWWHEWFLS